MVLGENGTAFGTDGKKAVSFNVDTGSVNWTWDAPDGELEMIAATAGNGLVAKVPAGNGEERVVRLDSSGQASYDDWTGHSIHYAYGDMWIRQGSTEVISAAANLWPWSVWSSPSIEDSRSAIGPVSVRVSKVSEANVDDTVIQARVESGISYWAKKARILLDWDGSISAVPACAPDLPDCVVDPFHTDPRDITEVVDANLAELLRRFPQTSKGVHILFTNHL